MRYAVAAALVGATFATPLTIIDPCPAASTKYPEITVTAQYQPVETCVPTSTCSNGDCITDYSMSTSTYVSTVIPCAVDGTSASSCTVTKTDQIVPCSEFHTTLTSTSAVPTYVVHGNMTKSTTSIVTSYETVSKEWSAPYHKIGPMGIPGYEGGNLCRDCDAQSDGSRSQYYDIKECHATGSAAPVCSSYPFTWVSKHAPSATAPASAVCSSKAAVTAAGTYTYTFPQVAHETTISSQGSVVTVPAQPWFAHVTTKCNGPTTFDFTVTVTKTITYNVPYPKGPAPSGTNTYQEWGAWQLTATTPVGGDHGSTNAPGGSWPAQTSPSSKAWDPPMTSGANTYEWGSWASSTSSSYSTSSTGSSSSQSSSYSTSYTSSTSSHFFSSSSTSTSPTGGQPTDGPTTSFYVSVITNPGQRFRKRAAKYIGFTGEDGLSVDKAEAALFRFDAQGELRTGGEFVLHDSTSAFRPFEKAGSPSTTGSKFSGSVGQPLVLPGASFCLANDEIIIVFSAAPSGCVPVSLVCSNGDDTTTSTSSTTVTPTTTSSRSFTTSFTTTTSSFVVSTTTTSSAPADVSADLDVPDPTPEPGTSKARRIRGMKY